MDHQKRHLPLDQSSRRRHPTDLRLRTGWPLCRRELCQAFAQQSFLRQRQTTTAYDKVHVDETTKLSVASDCRSISVHVAARMQFPLAVVGLKAEPTLQQDEFSAAKT